MGYTLLQIGQILSKADKTMYKIGNVAYDDMFSELDEKLDYERDIIFIYKKAVEYADDYYVGTTKLDTIVERLAGKLAIYDYGSLNPIYSDATIVVNTIPSGAVLNDLADVTITNLQNNQILKYNSALGQWVNTGTNAAIRSSQSFTATLNQTVFTTTSPFEPSFLDVFLNGVRLNSSSYTTFGEYQITLLDGCLADDILDVIIYDPVTDILDIAGYVPYTGATANVNLGEYEIRAGQFTLDTSPTGTAAVGTTRWNDTIGSSETTLKGGSVILKNGVDLVARVVNKVTPNTTLTKAAYQAVRVSGAQGQRLAVAYAQANNDNNSADTIGLVTETIPTNQEGFVMTVGNLEDINTTGSLQGETWADGDVLYLSPTTPGAITNVKPVAPQHIIVIGYVEYAHPNHGKIYVKIMNGWELGELHDVNTIGAVAGQVLKFNGTIWVPSSDSGITSLNSLNASSQTFATGTSGTDFNISSATSTHTFNLPTASAVNRGALSSADWTTFNNKQNTLILTTTGSSGSSTLVGSTLNVPTYTLSGLGGVPTTRTLNINGYTYDLSADRSWTIPTHDALTLGTANGLLLSSQVLSLSLSNATTTGALSSTDWVTFNNKQNAITLTTTGSSGAATLIGSTLNIPQYSGTNIYNSDGTLTGNRTVTMAGNYLRHTGGIVSVFNSSGTEGILEINSSVSDGNASLHFYENPDGLNKGYGSIIRFVGNGNTLRFIEKSTNETEYLRQSASQSVFKSSLGVGGLHTFGALEGIFDVYATPSTNGMIGTFRRSGNGDVMVGFHQWGSTSYAIGAISGGGFGFFNGRFSGAAGTEVARFSSSNNFLIGTATDAGFKLDVNGTARFQGSLTFNDTFEKKIIFSQTFNGYAIGFAAGSLNIGGDNVNIGSYSGTTFTSRLIVTSTNVSLQNNTNFSGGDWLSNVKISVYPNMGIGVSGGMFRFSSGGTGNDFVFFDNSAGNQLYKLVSLTGAGLYGTGNPDASAQLQVNSSSRGFLQPRMTTTQRDAISTPATGLSIYNTTTNTSDFYNGTSWVSQAAGNIYTADGTLTANRTLTSGGFNLTFTGSNTASGAIARGLNLTHTLVAAANNDVLVGLDINPTFTNGAFTGVSNYGLRVINSQAFFGGLSSVAMFIADQSAIRGNATTNGTIYIDVSRDLTGTMNLRATTISLGAATTSAQQINCTGLLASSINTVIESRGTGIASFRINNTTSAATWYFESHRNAPSGSLEITNNVSNNPCLTLFSTRNVGINTNVDGGFKFDVNGSSRFQNQVTISANGANITGAITASSSGHRFGNFQILTTGNATVTGLGFSSEGTTMIFQGYTHGAATITEQSYFGFRHYNNSATTLNGPNSSGILRVYNIGWTDGNTNSLSGNTLWLQPIYNFAGTRTGIIVRGFYYDPVLTSITNTTHRAIETVSGDVLLGTTSGNVGIGTATLGTATEVTIGGSQTASSAIARGTLINTTLTAAANNDVLVGLDINPTFTNGAFTGVSNYGLRLINSQAFFGGLSSVAMFIADQSAIRGNATTNGTIYIDVSRDLTGTMNLRATTISLGAATTSAQQINCGGLLVSSLNSVLELRATGIPKFRINNLTSATYWDFENHRSAPSGSLEITNSLGVPTLTLFSTRNIGVNTFTDAGFRLDVSGTARVQGQITSGRIVTSLLTYGVGIGNNALGGTITGGGNNVAVGDGAMSGSNSTNLVGNVAVGRNALRDATGTYNIAIGDQAMVNGNGFSGNIVIGDLSMTSGISGTSQFNNVTVIGRNIQTINANVGYSVALGSSTRITSSNQFVCGQAFDATNNGAIQEVYFGSGVQRNGTDNRAGVSYSINGSGALGTDFAGGNITIAGGKGTGTGTPGAVIFSTSTALTTGTTLQSLTERARIDTTSLTLANAINIVVGTTTGTKIGTATSQKIGFWNATPIVQPTTAIAEAAFVENSGGTAVNVDSTFAGYTLQQIAQALKDAGLLA